MRILTALLLIALISSCSQYSGPKEYIDIATNTKFEHLSGLYHNVGEPNGYLSQFIWGRAPINSETYKTFLQHRKIKYIKVISKNKSISVQAITRNCAAYEKEYKFGIDFEISDGEITLLSNASAISRGAGDPLVGPSFEKTSLSLDTKGNGVYTNETIAVGLVYLLVPVAISDKSEIRFKKAVDNYEYKNCYNR